MSARLYINGDSFVFGSELVEPITACYPKQLTPENNLIRLESCFGGVYAKNNGLELVNAGVGGCCNERIFRTTIQDCLSLEIGKQDTVIVQFTSAYRYEISESSKIISGTDEPHQIVAPFWISSRSTANKDSQKFASDMLKFKMSNDQFLLEDHIVHLIVLSSFLKNLGCKFLIGYSIPLLECPTGDRLESLSPNIMSLPMGPYCIHLGYRVGKNHHTLSEGHAFWAGYLQSKLEEIYA
jgi:hypothetical protein